MSIEIFLVLLSIVVFSISILSMINLLGKNMLLTMPGMFYVFFLIFIYLGSPYYYLYKGAINITYLSAVNSVLIILPLVILFTNKLMNIEFKETFSTYLKKSVIDFQSAPHFIFLYLFILLITISITILYFSKLEVIPINFLFYNIYDKIDLAELRELREGATTTFKLGKLHRYSIFMVQLLPFLVLIALFKSIISILNGS